jgi:hypothetical protein
MKVGPKIWMFLLLALSGIVTVAQSTERTPMASHKTINYRDAVSFAVPATWVEEDEPGVQGTFYEDAEDSGTLRVSVMQWTGEDEADRNRIVKSILLPGEVETLAQGVYLKREVKPGSEDGEALKLHRWLVVLALPDNVCRLIAFTHTVTAAQEDDPSIVSELATVDAAVRGATYSYRTALPLVDSP